jgi:hypothetical protein
LLQDPFLVGDSECATSVWCNFRPLLIRVWDECVVDYSKIDRFR